MPDVTSPILVSSSSPNRSSQVGSSNQTKPKQVIKKIPKVLKSLQRKSDRSQHHHNKTHKYHNHCDYHHTTNTTTTTSSTSSNHHNHLATSRVQVPKPKEGSRKEEERRERRQEGRRETTQVRIPERREEIRGTRREEEEEQAEEGEEERPEEMNRLSLDYADVNSSLYYATDERFKINKPPPSVPSSMPSSPLDHGDLSDLLSCPVCMEEYSTGGVGREPLFLSCHHSLCGQCLPQLVKTHHSKYSRDMSEVACPECRVVSLVPPGGLTQNFYLVSLLETRAATRSHRSTRLRMWCETCDSVALESCSTHPLTHLSTILQASTTTFTSTASRLSTILQSRSEEQGEAGRKLKDAVEVLDKASKSLRRRLVNRLDNATLAQATATSLLAEVDQMSRRVGCDMKISHEQSPRKRSKSPPMTHFTRAYSTPSSAVEGGKERNRGGKEDAGKDERRRLRKVRSDLTDLLTLDLENAYPNVADNPNWPEYLDGSPSSPVIPPPSSLYIPPFSRSSIRTTISFSPSVSSPGTAPCSSSSFPSSSTSPFSKRKTSSGISPNYFTPALPSKSSSLSSTPTTTPPSSPYLFSTSSSPSSISTFESLGSQEQEAKILLLKKCVETLGSMETTLMEGEERPKDKYGEGRNERADGERLENNREKSRVKEGVETGERNTRLTERVSRKELVMRGDKFGSLSKEMLLEMFRQALDALD